MAIRSRRGNDADFDKSKLLPGEHALVLDKGELYFCYGAGNSKKLQTAEDLQALLNASPTAYAALQQCVTDLNNNPSELASILANISALQTGKLDKTGNSQSNTVTFTEAVADADIATGDSHATLFGKILKRFNTITTALGLKQTIANMVQNDTTNDTTKYPSAAVAYQHGVEIDATNNKLALIGTAYLLGGLGAIGNFAINTTGYREIVIYIKTSSGGFLPPVRIDVYSLNSSDLILYPSLFFGSGNYLSLVIAVSTTKFTLDSMVNAATSLQRIDVWGVK